MENKKYTEGLKCNICGLFFEVPGIVSVFSEVPNDDDAYNKAIVHFDEPLDSTLPLGLIFKVEAILGRRRPFLVHLSREGEINTQHRYIYSGEIYTPQRYFKRKTTHIADSFEFSPRLIYGEYRLLTKKEFESFKLKKSNLEILVRSTPELEEIDRIRKKQKN